MYLSGGEEVGHDAGVGACHSGQQVPSIAAQCLSGPLVHKGRLKDVAHHHLPHILLFVTLNLCSFTITFYKEMTMVIYNLIFPIKIIPPNTSIN